MREQLLVYDLLVSAADRWPNNPVIHDEFGSMSFAEFLDEVNALKAHLKQNGVQEGMGIGVMARNGRAFMIGVFAVLGCGAAVLPISHQLKRPELEAILELTHLHGVLDDYSGIQPLREEQEITVDTAKFRWAWTEVDRKRIFAEHVKAPAFIRFTSGTTGVSKGVIISNQSVLERTAAANKKLQLGPQSNVVWVLPMAYHFVVSIVLYVRFGAAITIVKDFMAKSVLEMTHRYNGTLLYASPMQIRLLAADRSGEGLPSLKTVISTSAGISNEVSRQFKERYGITVHQAFGIIEIGLPIINDREGDDYFEYVGAALPDFDVRILDAENRALPVGEVGLLAIKGPGMFDAYLDPPVRREELLVDGYFLTADLASIATDGMIKIEGRKKSMINISGNKVFAEEVEHVLTSLPYVDQAKVSGVPHPLMGQVIQAEIVLVDDREIEVESILRYCRERLSTFKIPQKIHVVDQLEMTPTGKIKR